LALQLPSPDVSVAKVIGTGWRARPAGCAWQDIENMLASAAESMKNSEDFFTNKVSDSDDGKSARRD
jgi:hypothetical protein